MQMRCHVTLSLSMRLVPVVVVEVMSVVGVVLIMVAVVILVANEDSDVSAYCGHRGVCVVMMVVSA